MTNRFKKIGMALQNIFRRHQHKRSVGHQPADANSAEGWELVDGFNGNLHQELSMLQVSARAGGEAPKHIPDMLESSLPPYPVIWSYFLSKHYSDTEAENFYNRFQLVHWKSFGIKPIENWKELADRWMLQANNHQDTPLTQPKNDNETI